MNTLLDDAIIKAEAVLRENRSNKDLIYRLNLLRQCKEQGGELHTDGYIRYPNKPTLLGYD